MGVHGLIVIGAPISVSPTYKRSSANSRSCLKRYKSIVIGSKLYYIRALEIVSNYYRGDFRRLYCGGKRKRVQRVPVALRTSLEQRKLSKAELRGENRQKHSNISRKSYSRKDTQKHCCLIRYCVPDALTTVFQGQVGSADSLFPGILVPQNLGIDCFSPPQYST